MLKHSPLAAALLLAAATMPANALTVTLGDQDFANGAIDPNFGSASAGEPAPFNEFKGHDFEPGNPFSASWTFSYAPAAYTAATLTFGIYDHDSAASGDQVASFTADGNNLTSALNSLFNGSGGAQSEVNVYTLDLFSILSALTDGSVTFSLTLQGPGLGTPGEVPGNGAGLDIAQLNLSDPGVVAVPEPAGLALAGAGFIGLGLMRRKRRIA